jgi:hypothetical protein
MSRLDDAVMRLQAALDTLEACAGERTPTDSVEELSLLRSERERMMARIAALEEEARMLAGVTEDVEHRLDAAISEVRDVLGRN